MPQPEESAIPGHYADHAVCPLDLMAAYGLDIDFARGSIIKHVARAHEKDGYVDYEKVLWYAVYLVVRAHPSNPPADLAIHSARAIVSDLSGLLSAIEMKAKEGGGS